MHNFKFAVQTTLGALALALSSSPSLAADKDELIALARSAAPAMVSADATVLYRGEVLAEGSNGWTCLPETLPDDGAPMCNDAVWMEMMQAMGQQADFEASGIGISYMLQGDAGVSNSNPMHPMGKNAPDFIKEGAHLMVIVPKAMLEGITDDPHGGGPYVMWGDTPYAHIMIPLEDR
ncbi:hypothetical protein DWB85_05890 [Seongchinamella sediminis]|uniref:Uncharacterized protein n=1 Tax=Seongchinamella sediminis TaxID=2283635 RepID=A0A3L7E2J9_9GAMM|nr:hypothetical protein [Seongchinamella sediminis]RLQ22990.1 hypothetical protein DWB85_05890 [Seongchinamella sediminis]